MIGTPAYASPEMIEGLDPDPRDDVFALACIVYELLTGRHPFGRVPASVARISGFAAKQPAALSQQQHDLHRANAQPGCGSREYCEWGLNDRIDLLDSAS